MNLKEYCEYIETWLIEQLENTKMDGYILGISGGLDSAMLAGLAQKAVGNKLFGVVLPCESNPIDEEYAVALLGKLGIEYTVVDLTQTYNIMKSNLEKKANEKGFELDSLSCSNLKVRLRMCTLYAFGQARRSLVLGTDNLDEYYTGYFTKYGDGGVDLLPIVHLTKGEVKEAAKLYGVTQEIIDRKPSAGLFEGQTDENEMGVTYDELDSFLLGGKIDEDKERRIFHLHKISEHKRNPIPRPNNFERK